MHTKLVVWSVDIGSVSKNHLGWCRAVSAQDFNVGTEIMKLAIGIAEDLSAGWQVALGFECPLFVPVAKDPENLTKARQGEKDRAWSAGAGSSVLATGLVESVWIFEKIREHTQVNISPTFTWSCITSGQCNLFVWEALISKSSKGASHCDDARIAAQAFWSEYPAIEKANAVTALNPYSLAGAALLRAQLSSDIKLLSTPCVVIARHK